MTKTNRQEIEDLTILIATAIEEGSEEEHKRVVDQLLTLLKKETEKAESRGIVQGHKDGLERVDE